MSKHTHRSAFDCHWSPSFISNVVSTQHSMQEAMLINVASQSNQNLGWSDFQKAFDLGLCGKVCQPAVFRAIVIKC